jgi:recombination protein RecR
MLHPQAKLTSRDPLSKLIFELAKLPGIGEKTATRLAYHILKQDDGYAHALSDALLQAKTLVRLCEDCFAFTDSEKCSICTSLDRDRQTLCVIERPADLSSIERAHTFRGLYHVLHGVLSPLDGVGPEELRISPLLKRVAQGGVREVILALNPSVEGDATALYLTKLLKPLGARVSRLAAGIPVGGQLEFTDRQTLARAIENRLEASG